MKSSTWDKSNFHKQMCCLTHYFGTNIHQDEYIVGPSTSINETGEGNIDHSKTGKFLHTRKTTFHGRHNLKIEPSFEVASC